MAVVDCRTRFSASKYIGMENTPLPGFWKVTMWGMSPACDLLELIDKEKLGSCSTLEKKEINILLVGQKDIRHSLQTLKAHWKTLKENGVRLNFYVVESCLELYARQMLFWKIAFEPNNKLELDEKVKQFGEVHGNSLIRPETWKTVMSFSDLLIDVLTAGSNSPPHLTPMLDVSELKFQDRNVIVEIIKFWNNGSFNMPWHWNTRVRQDLGAEFQNAYNNIFDDYNANTFFKGLMIMSTQEYVQFRAYGFGFMMEEKEKFTQPNLTLASNIEACAETPGFCGVGTNYWGDIITGPFICHGLECEDSSVFETLKIQIGPMVEELKPCRSTDITIRNLRDIFNVISNDPMPDAEPTTDNHESTGQNQNPNISVHFVSMSNFHEFPSNLKYKGFFDVFYFGNDMVDQLLPRITSILTSDAILLVENARYVNNLPAAEEELFTARINEAATNIGFEPIESFDMNKYDLSSVYDDEIKTSILKYGMKFKENNANSAHVLNSVNSNPDPETQNEVNKSGGGEMAGEAEQT